MKLRSLFILLMLSISIASADDRVDAIYDKFIQGKLKEAETKLHRLPSTTVRDGNRLFLAALFEVSGSRARAFFEAAIKSDIDGKYLPMAKFHLLQLDFAAGNYGQVLRSGNEFLDNWEDSPLRDKILALMAASSATGGKEQKRYYDLLIDQYPGEYTGLYARVAKAYQAFGRKHFKTTTTICRRISNSANDDLTPTALILMARIALIRGESDRALLNYNILREQYPFAIGQSDLLIELKQVSDRTSGREAREKIEGITYSIKVGVFSQKGNAKKMADRMKGYGYKTEIKKLKISGKSYYVPMAGKFDTLKEAQIAKAKLEMGENQIFEIKVNDEK